MGTNATMSASHSKRWMLRAAVALTALEASLPIAASSHIANAATSPPNAPPVSLIGDSTMAGGAARTPVQTELAMHGRGGVPENATAVWLNLTVADPTAPTVLTAYPGPCGTARLSSNVNARPLRSTASSVLVGLGANGSVCVLTYTAHLTSLSMSPDGSAQVPTAWPIARPCGSHRGVVAQSQLGEVA